MHRLLLLVRVGLLVVVPGGKLVAFHGLLISVQGLDWLLGVPSTRAVDHFIPVEG
jgi:hypothetical protein